MGIPLRDFERFAPQETINAENLLGNILTASQGYCGQNCSEQK